MSYNYRTGVHNKTSMSDKVFAITSVVLAGFAVYFVMYIQNSPALFTRPENPVYASQGDIQVVSYHDTMNGITEAFDIQPAAGYRLLQPTVAPTMHVDNLVVQ